MTLPTNPVVLAASADAGTKEIQPRDFYKQALADGATLRAKSEEVAAWQKDGSVVLVDLRSKDAFARKHLRGAINIPVTELTDEVVAKALPKKDARIVTYCDDQLLPTRRIALTTLGVPSLKRLGYTNVLMLEDLWLRADCNAVLPFEESTVSAPKK